MRYSQPSYPAETLKLISRTLDSLNTAGGGKLTEQLEKEAALFVGAKFAVAVCNATMGLWASVRTMQNLGHFTSEDEFIRVPDMTYPATANAALFNGMTVEVAQPDIVDRMVMTLDPVYKSIGVTFAGYQEFKGSPYIMDDAHMMKEFYFSEKTVKPLCSVTSLHAIKQLGIGEGGLIFTDDEQVYHELLRLTRNKMSSTEPVLNLRLSDVMCAIALAKLPYLEEERIHKLELAQQYEEGLKSYEEKVLPMFSYQLDKYSHALHLMCLTFDTNSLRNKVANALRLNGIETRVHFPPLTQVYKIDHSEAYQTGRRGSEPKVFTDASNRVSAKHYATALSVPLHQGLNKADIKRVLEVICQQFS